MAINANAYGLKSNNTVSVPKTVGKVELAKEALNKLANSSDIPDALKSSISRFEKIYDTMRGSDVKESLTDIIISIGRSNAQNRPALSAMLFAEDNKNKAGFDHIIDGDEQSGAIETAIVKALSEPEYMEKIRIVYENMSEDTASQEVVPNAAPASDAVVPTYEAPVSDVTANYTPIATDDFQVLDGSFASDTLEKSFNIKPDIWLSADNARETYSQPVQSATKAENKQPGTYSGGQPVSVSIPEGTYSSGEPVSYDNTTAVTEYTELEKPDDAYATEVESGVETKRGYDLLLPDRHSAPESVAPEASVPGLESVAVPESADTTVFTGYDSSWQSPPVDTVATSEPSEPDPLPDGSDIGFESVSFASAVPNIEAPVPFSEPAPQDTGFSFAAAAASLAEVVPEF